MSTPRTDEREKDYWDTPTSHVDDVWDFARELERENAALRKALKFAVAAYKEDEWPDVLADNLYEVSCVARIALNGKEAQP